MTQYTKSLHILQITFTVFYLKYSEVFIRWELKQKASLNKGCPAPVKTSERDALLTANPTQAAALEHQMSTIYFLYAFPHYIKRKPRDNPAHIQPQRAVTILWNAFLITPITKALCNLIRNRTTWAVLKPSAFTCEDEFFINYYFFLTENLFSGEKKYLFQRSPDFSSASCCPSHTFDVTCCDVTTNGMQTPCNLDKKAKSLSWQQHF